MSEPQNKHLSLRLAVFLAFAVLALVFVSFGQFDAAGEREQAATIKAFRAE